MNRQVAGLIAVLAVILLSVVAVVIYNEWPLMTGERVVLATRPVDPFDPFRGQYMAINYEISSLPVQEGIESGDKVFVALSRDNAGIWRSTQVTSVMPNSGAFIKGKVTRKDGGNMQIEYGIEQFFFERNADVPTNNITVEVAIASSGRARLVQLLKDGEPVEIVYRNYSSS